MIRLEEPVCVYDFMSKIYGYYVLTCAWENLILPVETEEKFLPRILGAQFLEARLAQSVEHQTFKADRALERSEGQGFKSLIGLNSSFR